MGIVHFLDVGWGDCSVIEHISGRVTMIDVCKARSDGVPFRKHVGNFLVPQPRSLVTDTLLTGMVLERPKPQEYENPVSYLKSRGIPALHRFILTHPDMDHMDGIKDIFAEFRPDNFWDIENRCEKTFTLLDLYRSEDWKFYQELRQGYHAKRLALLSGATGTCYNEGDDHDGLHVLAPTWELQQEGWRKNDYDDAGYVVLYVSQAGRVLFCGDSHNKTWEHLLTHHLSDIQNVEVLIAPHHGRDSDRDREFINAVNPKLTLFGRAPAEHMMYNAWRSRKLAYITAAQAGTVMLDTSHDEMRVYVTNEGYARRNNPHTFFDHRMQAWFLQWFK